MGWVILIVVAATIVALQLAGSLFPDAHDTRTGRIEDEVRVALRTRNLVQALGGSPQEAEQELRRLLARLRKVPGSDLAVAALEQELNGKADPELVDKLAKSGARSDRAAAEILRAKRLTVERAKVLADAVGTDSVYGQLLGAWAYDKAGDPGPLRKFHQPARMAPGTMVLLGLLVLGSSLVLWLIYVVGRATGRWRPVGLPLRHMSLLEADGAAFRVALCLLGMIGIQAVGAALLSRYFEPTLAAALAALMSVFWPLWVIGRRIFGVSLSLRQVVGGVSHFGRLAGWGAAGAIANVPILLVLSQLGMWLFRFMPLPHHPLTDTLSQEQGVVVLVSAFVLACVAAPLLEETVFRGLLLPAITRVSGSLAAGAILSGLLFGLMHPQGLPLVPALAGVGIMAALLTYQTGSLVPAIVMHACHNGALLALQSLAV
jgi:membrane protease YdiL (CAAX protease family)